MFKVAAEQPSNRMLLLAKTIYDLPVRVSELAAIMKGDIGFDRGTIKIHGKGARFVVMLPAVE